MDKNDYLNKCAGSNQIQRIDNEYGYKTIHQVEDKKVVLSFNVYANGEDDFDEELVDVEIL